MLAKKFRLQASEVKEVLELGSTLKSRLFIIRAQKAAESEKDHKFATVISTRFAKKAVVRNYLRRQIHEIIRLNKQILENGAKLQLVFIPKKYCLSKTYQELEADIIYIFQNIKKWLSI